MEFENTLQLGIGIYTPSEIAQILRISYAKVSRWINKYWDGELGLEYESRYSWTTGNSKAVSFHTLVEFYVMMQLSEAGVNTRKILIAHQKLSKEFNTAFPFALNTVLQGIFTDGNKIYFKIDNDTLITLDGTKQLNLQFIQVFFKNLDFDSDNLASKFYPLGKKNSIVVDPKRKFGHPVVGDSNIYPETIYSLYKAGENKKYISYLYDLKPKEVNDAISYCLAA